MNLPVKYKSKNLKNPKYIKYDDNNNPEYCFEVSGRLIKRFIPLTDKEIDIIVLPKLVESYEFILSGTGEKSISNSSSKFEKEAMRDYIVGHVKIGEGCFEGIDHAKILVPFEDSIMIDWNSFEKDAKIEFVLPRNLSLKQIYRQFDSGFDYESENWTLIGDQKITGSFNFFLKDFYNIQDYNENKLSRRIANFTISHLDKGNSLHQEQNDCQI